MWRTYGYQTYPASIAAVNLVKVMLEGASNKLLDKDNCCDIVVYFNRPIVLSTLKFTEMFNLYSWSYKLLKHFKNNLQLRNSEYWEIQIQKLPRKIFVMKKVSQVLLLQKAWYVVHIFGRDLVSATNNGVLPNSFMGRC